MATLQDQLDELRDNVLQDTSDLIAGDNDQLWSDETLLRYIRDAENIFARRTFCIRDDSLSITLVENQAAYPMPKGLISVLSARYELFSYDMTRSGHAVIYEGFPENRAELLFDPLMPFSQPPGTPGAFYTDETLVTNGRQQIKLTIFPAPSSTEAGNKVLLRTIRRPKDEYSVDCLDRESEIPDDYWLDVLEWAAFRAQRKYDADASAQTTAEAHRVAFDNAVKQAKKDFFAKLSPRTGMAYGRYGWAWSRA